MKMLKQILSLSTAFLLILNITAQVPGNTGGGSTKEVSDTEVKNFAKSYPEVKQVQKEFQQKMRTAITEQGLTMQKYKQITKSARNPNSQGEVSKEDQEKYQQASKKLQTVRQEMKTSMEEILNKHDLTLNRFNQIFMQMRQDKELQKKVKAEMDARKGQGQGADSQKQ